MKCTDSYCNQKSGHHRSSGCMYITIDPINMLLRQHCFKGTCVSEVQTSESKMWPTWYLRDALPLDAELLVASIRIIMYTFIKSTPRSEEFEDCSVLKTSQLASLPSKLDALEGGEMKTQRQDTMEQMQDMYTAMSTDDLGFRKAHDLPPKYESFTMCTTTANGGGEMRRMAPFELRMVRRLNALAMYK